MVIDLMNKIKSDSTDKQLIEVIRKHHNEKAFALIFNRYSSEIKKHLKYKTNHNASIESSFEDVINETFITLWENIINDKFKTQGYLKAYLKKIAYYKLLKITKNNKLKPIDEIEKLSDDKNEEELLYILDDDVIDYKSIAEKALSKLSEICLKIIILKYYDKMSDREIFSKLSDQLESIRNVRSRRSHCMEKLRKDSDAILKKMNQQKR